MGRRFIASISATALAILFASLAPALVAGQAPKTKAWTAPRTADGQPDLQGVWANNVATPLQRPKALEGKTTLTDEEVVALKAAAAQLFDGGGDAAFGDSVFDAALAKAKTFVSRDGKTGDYNQFWLVDRDFDRRTSLITDPTDGRIPPLTKEGADRAAAAARRRTGEGVTLVVDTTNYASKAALMNATDKLHIIERFTRVGPKTINWEVTFDDPAT